MSWRSAVAGGVGLVAAAAAVVLAGSVDPQPVQPHPRAESRPVTSAVLSCPVPPSAPSPATTLFAVGPAKGRVSTGTARVLVAGSTASSVPPLATTAASAVPVRAISPSNTDAAKGVLVAADGALAPGLTAAELSTYTGDNHTGLAASACLSPRGEWWFSGVDTSVGTTTSLVLVNPGPALAVVDLEIFGPEGAVDAAGSSGIALAPGSRQVLDLARYAPGLAALTLHVSATQGSVSAAVSTTRLAAVTPTGADWVSPSADPAPDVVVDAGVGLAVRQTLVITNPGTRQQLVKVRILDKDGAFTSTELESVQVPPGATVTKDITSITLRQPTAVQLTAAAPVTGAIVSERAQGVRDFAVATTSDVLVDPAVVPRFSGTTLTLAFASAGPAPTRIRLRTFNGFGRVLDHTTLVVGGSATTTWTLPRRPATSYVVIRVLASSRLHAVATYAGVAGITQLPVDSGRWTALRPAVLPS